MRSRYVCPCLPWRALLPEAFAVVREAIHRILGMRLFPVQLLGGIALHQGKIAEMATGEGKTLVASLPAYLNGLAGKGVHVVTTNDYLAQRDRDLLGPVYQFLGLSTGVLLHGRPHLERRQAYRDEVSYGSNKEFGFDYLRDHLPRSRGELLQQTLNGGNFFDYLLHGSEVPPAERIQRELHYAIVDEISHWHALGRPVLVGTISVADSERLSEQLARRNVPHRILNAKQDAEEAQVVANAGRFGAVTIATNMAGRGTDILLGGLHVIGSVRHESRRIDHQLRGRAGRQGDPGSSQFYLSLEDEIMRLFLPGWMRAVLRGVLRLPGGASLVLLVARTAERYFCKIRRKLLQRSEAIRKGVAVDRLLGGGVLGGEVVGVVDGALGGVIGEEVDDPPSSGGQVVPKVPQGAQLLLLREEVEEGVDLGGVEHLEAVNEVGVIKRNSSPLSILPLTAPPFSSMLIPLQQKGIQLNRRGRGERRDNPLSLFSAASAFSAVNGYFIAWSCTKDLQLGCERRRARVAFGRKEKGRRRRENDGSRWK
ncbi:MAG: hypothetical protein HYS70_04525 [Nitrospinae bacterium]|nr:hypothetical protein [Nitrospinota bacterium]